MPSHPNIILRKASQSCPVKWRVSGIYIYIRKYVRDEHDWSGISVAKYAPLNLFCRLQFLRWCYINFGLIADQLDYSWLYSRTFKQRHSPFPLHPNSQHDHSCHYLRLHHYKWLVLYWRASSCEQGSKASQPTGKDQGAQFWDVYSLQLVAGGILQDKTAFGDQEGLQIHENR